MDEVSTIVFSNSRYISIFCEKIVPKGMSFQLFFYFHLNDAISFNFITFLILYGIKKWYHYKVNNVNIPHNCYNIPFLFYVSGEDYAATLCVNLQTRNISED